MKQTPVAALHWYIVQTNRDLAQTIQTLAAQLGIAPAELLAACAASGMSANQLEDAIAHLNAQQPATALQPSQTPRASPRTSSPSRDFVKTALTTALKGGLEGDATVELDGQRFQIGLSPGDQRNIALEQRLRAISSTGQQPDIRIYTGDGAHIASTREVSRVLAGQGKESDAQNLSGYIYTKTLPFVISPDGKAYIAYIAPAQMLRIAKTGEYVVPTTHNNRPSFVHLNSLTAQDTQPEGAVPVNFGKSFLGQGSAGKTLREDGFAEIRPGVFAKGKNIFLVDHKGNLAAVLVRPIDVPKITTVTVNPPSDIVKEGSITLAPGSLKLRLSDDGGPMVATGLGTAAGTPFPTPPMRAQAAKSFAQLGLPTLDATPLEPGKYATYEQQMRPGQSASDNGFLSPDESLAKVLRQDDETIARLGITHLQLASALQLFQTMVDKFPQENRSGQPKTTIEFNGQRFTLQSMGFMGGVESPITGKVYHRTYAFKNESTGAEIRVNGVDPSLIARGFYQGPSRTHRQDPVELFHFFAGNNPDGLLRELDRLGVPK